MKLVTNGIDLNGNVKTGVILTGTAISEESLKIHLKSRELRYKLKRSITIVYRKDSSSHSGDDRGYVLIPKNQ